MNQEISLNSQSNPAPKSLTMNLQRKPRLGETLISAFLFFCGFVSIFTTLGIVSVLGFETYTLFTSEYEGRTVSPLDFITETQWQPAIFKVGIWPLITATLVISSIGLVVAIPLGLGAAIYLSEYATPRARALLKPILEVLAGIPTVVYGYFALTFVTPILQSLLGQGVGTYNMLAAGLVVGVMITPLIASLSEDALNAVPRAMREGAYGLGSTQLEVTWKVVVPAAVSGIMAAVILAVSRAVGETMIVALAAGAGSNLTLDPRDAAENIPAYIARISTGDVSFGSLDYNAIFALGLTLFFLTLILNMISRYIINRFREAYE
jgi:phosphate transport system permease protein